MKYLSLKPLINDNKISLILLFLLALGAPMIYSYQIYVDETYNLPKSTFAYLITTILLSIALLKSSHKRNYVIYVTPFLYPFSAYILSQIIATFDAINIFESINQITITVFHCIIAIFVANLIKHKRDPIMQLTS